MLATWQHARAVPVKPLVYLTRGGQGGKPATLVIAAAADIKFRVAESRCNSPLSAVSHSVSCPNRRFANNVERTAAKRLRQSMLSLFCRTLSNTGNRLPPLIMMNRLQPKKMKPAKN